MGSTLPPKEQTMFKNLLKYYEQKQYRRAQKTADLILKKHPNHGETLSMKGLVLSYLNKKEEAYELVRLGLRNDLKSHVCWHVYGLLHRADRNYEEAIKCYRNALKIDKDNFQIMRDLALLEVQTRNLEAFSETRQQLLATKPNQKASWAGLAIAYQLAGNYEMALKVMDVYDGTQEDKDSETYDFEHSEMVMYKSMLYEESGRYKEGYDHLLKIQPHVCDIRAWKESRVSYLLKLERFSEAAEHQRALIAENPENVRYYKQMEKCLGLESSNVEGLVSMYKELSQAHPKAHVPKRALLDLLEGAELRQHLDDYLQFWLNKGAPSLFVTIKPVYKRAGVAAVIDEILQGYLKHLPEKLTDHDTEPQSPTTQLWTIFYAAQHYAHLGKFDQALTFIDQAIAHTPTVVEIVQGKAKILKQAGDYAKAAEFSTEARLLDLQDRFINSKNTKYLIRNGQIAQAEEVVGLFAKGEPGEQVTNLTEMQCMWFALECGRNFNQQKQWGKALKKFHEVYKHFQDISDDQLDFHAYCLRKITLRAYLRLLRVEDMLHEHRFYLEAAKGAIEVYLSLHDKPKAAIVGGQEVNLDNLTEAERKKALSKLKKAEAIAKATKQAQTDAAKQAKESGDVKKSKKSNKPVDEDPDGIKLLETTDPLGEAVKFLQPLLQQLPNRIETHILACEIYNRRGKFLLVLRSLQKGFAIDAENPDLHRNAVRFLVGYAARTDLNATVRKILDDGIAKLFGNETNAEAYTAAFLKRHATSTAHVIAAAESIVIAKPERKAEAVDLLSSLSPDSLKHAVAVHRLLTTTLNNPTAAAAFQAKMHTIFPHATVFASIDATN